MNYYETGRAKRTERTSTLCFEKDGGKVKPKFKLDLKKQKCSFFWLMLSINFIFAALLKINKFLFLSFNNDKLT